jgi:non-ribosomal peptide synthetase component E (peptide arylation enzyme)
VLLEKNGHSEIILFVESVLCNAAQLTEYLRTKLPAYMIPSQIIYCRQFPLNANGKTDKIALKEMLNEGIK